MTPQAAPAAPAPANEAERPAREEVFRQPPAKVRHAYQVLVAGEGDLRLIVQEERTALRLCVDDGKSVVRPSSVRITVPEARRLADNLNRICRRILTRPDYAP